MSDAEEPQRDWKEAVEDGVWARWRWLVIFVVVVFALNNLAGLLAGGLGLIAFAHRISGQALRAKRLAQQVRQIVSDTPDEGA